MKRFSFVAFSFIFAAVCATSAFGQVAADGKIGLVNIAAFADEKAGIAKFRKAFTDLDQVIKPLNDELKTLGDTYTKLRGEIDTGQKAQGSGAPIANLNAKIEQAQTLELQIKRKQEDGKAKYEREYQRLVGPVFNDIIKALNDYAKQKGYAVILDGAKLEEAQILLGFNDKFDVTKDFINFYNARPAGAATAAAAK